MKYLKFLILPFFFFSCNPETEVLDCNSGIDPLNNLVVNQGDKPEYEVRYVENFYTHRYSFSSKVPGKICSVGYQSDPGKTYTFKIFDSEGRDLTDVSYAFSDTKQEYLSIVPVTINANEVYTITRTVLSDSLNTGGMIAKDGGFDFPVQVGDFTILGTSLSGGGDPWINGNIPYISFNFLAE